MGSVCGVSLILFLSSILTCEQYVVGSNGTLEVSYTKGGVPTVLVPSYLLKNSGLCGYVNQSAAQGTQVSVESGAYLGSRSPTSSISAIVLLFVVCLSTLLAM